jgi:hypothetical protein
MRLFAAPSAALVEPGARAAVEPSQADSGTAQPPRVTIPAVEIARVGTYDASTGQLDITADDLQAMLDAYQAQVARQPVVKLGHLDPLNDGAPSMGWLANLQLSPDGQCLTADMCGVPSWLADALPSAYPSRSIEAVINYVDADGQVWPMVLDGLALLGATTPAMGSLAAIRELVTASRRTSAASRVAAARARRRRRTHYQ